MDGLPEAASLLINHAMLIERHRRKYTATAPDLARWMKCNLQEGFTIFAFPEPVSQRLQTSNLCEALKKIIRCLTRLASIFPNLESCLRLVAAILMEISEQWEDAKAYLNPQLLT